MAASKSPTRYWGLLLFSLPFAGVGIGIFLFSILPTFYDALRMSDWPSAQADLVYAELIIDRGSESSTYKAQARYSYQINGVYYTNDRVAISARSDNIGSFNEDLGYRLESAYNTKIPINIWYNPQNPQDSIIDRSLRPGLLLFKMIFVVVFGGAGVGLLVFAWSRKEEYVQTHAGVQSPWLNFPAWADNKIRSEQKTKVKFVWFFAGIWNAISLPLGILVVPDILARGNYIALIVLLFPIIGLGLLYWAIKNTLDYRRYGDPILVLDPFPGSIGGDFGGYIALPNVKMANFSLTLSCIHVMPNHGTDNKTLEAPHWQTDGAALLKPNSHDGKLSFRFSIPDNLPPSEPPQTKQSYYKWRFDIESRDITPSFSRQYDVPVFATCEKATQPIEDAQQHPLVKQQQAEEAQSALDIEFIPGGVAVNRGYLHNARLIFSFLIFGVIFMGSGGFFLSVGAPIFLPYLFIIIGFIATAVCLHSFMYTQRIEIDRNGIRLERRYLGLFTVRRNVVNANVHHLNLKQSYSTQHEGKYKIFFKVQACLNQGKPISITGSIPGEVIAQYWLERICQQTGYQAQ